VSRTLLRGDTPEADRKFISEMLNRTHEYSFDVDPSSGRVRVSRWKEEHEERGAGGGGAGAGGGGAEVGGAGGGRRLTMFEAGLYNLNAVYP
jgi:hypothetical protein